MLAGYLETHYMITTMDIFKPKMLTDQRKSHKELIQRQNEKQNRQTARKAMKVMNFVDYDLEPQVIKREGKEVNSFCIVLKNQIGIICKISSGAGSNMFKIRGCATVL